MFLACIHRGHSPIISPRYNTLSLLRYSVSDTHLQSTTDPRVEHTLLPERAAEKYWNRKLKRLRQVTIVVIKHAAPHYMRDETVVRQN